MLTGGLPSRAAAAIYRALFEHERRTRSGRAYADNTGFLQGAPIFAAEVRSEDDYGPPAERAMAARRAEAPDVAIVCRRGERAEGAPALPGFTLAVDDLFE